MLLVPWIRLRLLLLLLSFSLADDSGRRCKVISDLEEDEKDEEEAEEDEVEKST